MKRHHYWGLLCGIVALACLAPVILGVPMFLIPFFIWGYHSVKCFTEPEYAKDFDENDKESKRIREQLFSRKRDDEDDDY